MATSALWAYEARVDFLRRELKYSPGTASSLVQRGLWTGEYDGEGLPIPSEVGFRSGRWQREIFPTYMLADRTENKRRSLRDTLILSPESGPRLISAGLWTGRYDNEGLPIPQQEDERGT